MTEHPEKNTGSQEPDYAANYRFKTTTMRMLKGAAGGLALFAFGALVHQSGAWDKAATAMGWPEEKQLKDHADVADATAARREMAEARKVRAKDTTAKAPPQPLGPDGYFVPPPDSAIPKDKFGDAVRRGRDIFVDTGVNASQYVGNSMACAQCHLDGGRRENSAPMWAAYVAYPKFRAKNNQINTMEERITGCFTFSMNAPASPAGKAPPPGDAIYKDLMTYMYWLSDGAPTGENMPGAGYLKVPLSKAGYDPKRGLAVYEQNCVLCHGADGQGRKEADGKLRFPPLWGPEAYNWGAGMARVDLAAGFIKANMPLSKPYSLSDQEAWDVAAYIDSQERPKDPRQKGTIAENQAKNHGGKSYYGKQVDGHLLGTGVARAAAAAPAAAATAATAN